MVLKILIILPFINNKNIILTNFQKIALNYYNNLKIKIDYNEITDITKKIKKDLKVFRKN